MPEPTGTADSSDSATPPQPRLVLMGTGPFAVPSFAALQEAGMPISLVFTRPERQGPGKKTPSKSPVRQWAESRQLTVVAPESANSEEARQLLRDAQPDLLVVCDYGQILKGNVLRLAKWGGINLHGSLLPAFRGAAPVQWAVLTGQAKTGVSVIHMTPRLDAGPVITSRETEIGSQETAGDLEARLATLGVSATLEAVELLARELGSRDLSSEELPRLGQPQDPQATSQAPRLEKAEGRMPWRQSAAEIDWHVRGMQPWPGAFCEVPVPPGGKGQPLRLVILSVEPHGPRGPQPAPAGEVRIEGDQLLVACGDGWLEVKRLKPAGKREMTAAEWLRGRPLQDGVQLQ